MRTYPAKKKRRKLDLVLLEKLYVKMSPEPRLGKTWIPLVAREYFHTSAENCSRVIEIRMSDLER